MNLAATFPLASRAEPQPAPASHVPCKHGSAAADDAAAESSANEQEDNELLCAAAACNMQGLGPSARQQAGSVAPVMGPGGVDEGKGEADEPCTVDGAGLGEAAQALDSLIDAVVASQLGLAQAREGGTAAAAALAASGGSPGLPGQASCVEAAAGSRDLALKGGLVSAGPQQGIAEDSSSSLDSVDWERVRTAPVGEVCPSMALSMRCSDGAVGVPNVGH